MTEHEFTLSDRITKIQSINAQYDLEHNAYISFSGGKDSTVLHYLVDEALPNNNIPRVFLNTGLEYKELVKFVREMASKDSRFVILTVGKDIKKTLNTVGWPFKSKQHSQRLHEFKVGNRNKFINQYFRLEESSWRQCPYSLMYQSLPSFTMNISDKCCHEFKKKPAAEYSKQTGRFITLTGMLKEEGGQRNNLSCVVTDKQGKLKKFHPMAVVSHEWEKWFIEQKRIQLCLQVLCKWATTASRPLKVVWWIVQRAQLDTLRTLLPSEYKRAEYLWKPVYDEYRRIGYRLRKVDVNQPSLFEEFN